MSKQAPTVVSLATSMHDIPAQSWDALTDGSPILSHAFLSALESTACVGPGTGWQPCPVVAYRDQQLVGAVPMYLKSHSYGEYVFDWSWADAYQRNGMAYYPKLLVAVPFTPITGARLLSHEAEVQVLLADMLIQQIAQHGLSSAHVLFPDEAASHILSLPDDAGAWLRRSGVQFRWENEGFADFEAFLACLSHDKRKKIRQERRKVRDAGVSYRRLLGSEASSADWDFFFQCYENTYAEHHSQPYLTREFFHEIGRRLPDNVLLVIAQQNGTPVAAAFNLFDQTTLYGRYWGASRFVSGLHFELCYYQAQEFCIERGIRYFEGGAQGEHKLARGFRPRPTCSFHRIAHPDFEAAIARFVQQEASGMQHYQHELEDRAPFKQQAMSVQLTPDKI